MASREPGEAIGEVLADLLKVVFSLIFPLMFLGLCGASYLLLFSFRMPEFSLWAVVALWLIDWAKTNIWVAIGLGLFAFSSLPLTWLALREQELRASKIIYAYVIGGLLIGFQSWLRTVWPYSSGWQLWVYGLIMFVTAHALADALIGTLGVILHVRRNRPRKVRPPSTAQTQTAWLDSVLIRRDLSKGTADFGGMKREPLTVYLILPPRYLASHSTWLRIMITAVLQPLMRSAQPAKVPVLFMLDEFAQLGHLPVIEDNLALMREYGVKLWPVFQDLAQAQDIYKTRWESFISNAGVLQSFAPQDVTTRKYLSDLSGQRLYWLETTSRSTSATSGPTLGSTSGTQEGWQNMPGPVYWPQGLAAMQDGQAILFARGRAPRAWLPDPSEMPAVHPILNRAAREMAG